MKIRGALLLSAVGVLSTGAAYGQATKPAVPASDAVETGVEDIVVTAQRRDERLQDVPIAIAAVTATTAEKFGVTSPENLTQLTPGVTFTRQAQGGAPFIRGVGTSSTFIGNEPSVALFVDDVYLISGTASVFDFNNIEAVEVLKGPQGTLFGRNATGGVIHVRTRNPTFDTKVDATIGYGNYDTVTGQFYGSTGLTDKIAVNLAAFYTKQSDGWGKNYASFVRPTLKSDPIPIVPGKEDDLFVNESWGIRGKLLFEPTDDTSILLSASYNQRKSDQGLALRTVPGYFGRNGYSMEVLGGGFYDGVNNVGGEYNTRYQQYSAKVTHDFGAASLVSITSYSKLRTFAPFELDAAPADFLDSYNPYGADTFTQEVQLLSGSDSAVKWIIGAFYMHDKAFFEGFFSGPALTGANPLPGTPKYQTNYAAQVTDSYSGFAQASYEFLPATNMTIGIRYTSDNRSTKDAVASLRLFDDTALVTRGPFSDKVTYGALTGRFSIDHRFSDQLMVYAAYNRGFKSGVYNIAGYTPAVTAVIPPVEPETINSYTVGFKSDLFDRKVRFNFEAYYYDYANIQVQNNRPDGSGGTIFVNGGRATIKGFDADLTVAPVENLTVTAGVNVQKGKYDEFNNGPTFFPTGANAPIAIPAGCNFTAYPVSTGPAVQILRSATDPRSCNLDGNKTVLTPPFTLSLSAAYRVPMDDGGIDFAISYLHSGNYFFEPDNLSFTRQPKYDVLNGSIKFTTPDGRFDVKLWANNITKQKYFAYIANSATSGTKGSPATPRTYGLTLGAHF